tara:strand:- start:873 stop:1712 length:840 start_codon:yes stop_codon:yes gene_type:complete
MITSIIFSKDRPLQLDLCLKSLNKNFPDSENLVIYNNSSEFVESYEILKSEHSQVEYWPQSNSLFSDIYLAAQSSDNDYICFFTDDDIFYKKCLPIRQDILDNKDVMCLSLRMGANINQRSHEGNIFQDVAAEMYQLDENTICWNKTRNAYGSYWSYSLSVDGHIFRKQDILDIFDEMNYLNERYRWTQTPNTIESIMQRFWTTTPPMMASFPHSVVVNSPNNRVQDSHLANKSGEVYDYTSKDLLEKYMQGSRINIDNLDFGEIKCPHTEIDIIKGLE